MREATKMSKHETLTRDKREAREGMRLLTRIEMRLELMGEQATMKYLAEPRRRNWKEICDIIEALEA